MPIDAIIFTLMGLLAVGLSIPLIKRKVPMNHLYGIRIAAAFRSDADWYAINAYGGKVMLGWAGLVVLVGLLGFLVPDSHGETYSTVALVVVIGGLLIVTAYLYGWARRREQRSVPSDPGNDVRISSGAQALLPVPPGTDRSVCAPSSYGQLEARNPKSPIIITGLILIVSSLLTMGMVIPLAQGRVGMNGVYGVRIPKAFSSPENWRKINEYGGRCLLYWSVPVLLAGIATLIAGLRVSAERARDRIWKIVPIAGVVFLAVCMLAACVQVLLWSRNL